MSTGSNGAGEGGWAYHEVPRSEFYEELAALLEALTERVYDNPETARSPDEEIGNDWFFAGFGGAEDNFYVGLWPAYRPFIEGREAGEISAAEYTRMCWPRSDGQPVMIYIGDADAVIEVAEDDTSIEELANSFAELAGIELVDDWDAGEGEEGGDGE